MPLPGHRSHPPPSKNHTSGWTTSKGADHILDGNSQIVTGCAADDVGAAERKLVEYLRKKHRPLRKEKHIEDILITDVLAIYYRDRVHSQARPECTKARLRRLAKFWSGKTLAEVNGDTCRDYVDWAPKQKKPRLGSQTKNTPGGRRRDLEDLRAAVNHHSKEGLHRGIVRVTLPQKGRPRDRWLTRDEAAALIRACWRAREVQTQHRGKLKGQKIVTEKRPSQHIARFILIALYTGTRASAVAAASPFRRNGSSYVDLENGLFYRLAEGARETKKRQPPVPLPPRLLAHMRRWVDKKIAKQHFVEWNDMPVQSVTTGFKSAVLRAGLTGKVTPHTLRHTAATWLMKAGVSMWDASGFLGMTQETLENVYGHHHPEHLRSAAIAIGGQRRQSLAKHWQPKRSPSEHQRKSLKDNGGPGAQPACPAVLRARHQTPEAQAFAAEIL
ncbi:site-specific integrase [Pseudorhodoplanes sp.]|uniref:site-specific integrase n=1 Tax=Pseudorhodoplanes sp. TaxID=1934341 RepID=UPI003D099E70